MASFIWTQEAEDTLINLLNKHGYPLPAETAVAFALSIGAARTNVTSKSIHLFRGGEVQAQQEVDVEIDNMSTEDLSDVDLRVVQLERILLNKNDELVGLRKRMKLGMRDETHKDIIRDTLQSCIRPLPTPRPASNPFRNKKTKIAEDVVLHLSDEHADQIVLPHRVNGLEDYNLNVALARAERFVQQTLDYTQNTLSNYEFETLWILAYGDHVNGEIHNSTQNSTFENPFANAVAVGQMHALMIRDLSPYFKQVKVVYVAGNHGRITHKKDYTTGALNNWDYLVGEVAAGYCRDLVNVEFLIPDAFTINVNIRGYVFNISHGDDIRGWNGIPWYGIERRNRRLEAIHAAHNQKINYKVLGHFHVASTSQDSCGETIVNGSWKKTDEFVYNALGGVQEPMQWIHGVHDRYGVTWRLPVYLKFDGDTDGPSRYKVQFASPNMNDALEALR